MKNFTQQLDEYHLLDHPFYKAWSAGMLDKATLAEYGKQYFAHVDTFTRAIARTYSQCDKLEDRQSLLHNLMDEEQGPDNHPELWLRFLEGLGVDRKDVMSTTLNKETKSLIDGFFALCDKSYASGLGALYAYERQVPAVATSKIDGLKKFYGMDDERSLQFFTVHQTADEFHSEEVSGLIDKLSATEQEEAKDSSLKMAKLLWGFLDGMQAMVPCAGHC